MALVVGLLAAALFIASWFALERVSQRRTHRDALGQTRDDSAFRVSRLSKGTVADEPQEARSSAELLERITDTAVDSPLCMTCGTKMRPAGSCYVCEGCGSTSGTT